VLRFACGDTLYRDRPAPGETQYKIEIPVTEAIEMIHSDLVRHVGGRRTVDGGWLRDTVRDWLDEHGTELVTLRRHLHAHPELSGQEFKTTELIARELESLGLTPQLLPGGNGLVCDIGIDGPIIALRADLDALPLPDTKSVPYRSTVPNATHACGHDVHTTVLLGAARVLTHLHAMGTLPGRVRLIFQPAEERMPSGAPEVIVTGALEGVRSIFALHCAPHIEAGKVGVRSGPFTAAADKIEVRLTGLGGHTARPHLTADLVYALGRVIVDVPSLLDRRTDRLAGVSLVWGAVEAGEAVNAIPIEGTVRGTVRILNADAWLAAPDLVTRLIHDVVAATGALAEVTYTRGVPPITNDAGATAVISEAARAALGSANVLEAPVSMAGEDFAFYLQQVRGAMFRLGVGMPGAIRQYDLHQSDFDVDERAIGHGVQVMVHTAIGALTSPDF
jgi:amidohydrolase